MRKIRVGIIGASSEGGWALFGHLPALKTLPQFVVTAVCATVRSTRTRSPAATASPTFKGRTAAW